jgi:hypothetical protein
MAHQADGVAGNRLSRPRLRGGFDREFGYKVHSIEGEERVVIGVVGVGDVTACLESLEATPGVETRGAHLGALQVRQPRIPQGALAIK